MGIEIMNTAIGGHYSESEDEGAFIGNIHELADYAAARDILLGIEIHGEITKSAEAAIPVLRRIDRKNVLINYDTANAEFYGGVDPIADLKIALPKLVHSHLKDKRGEGRVWDFPAMTARQKCNPRGAVVWSRCYHRCPSPMPMVFAFCRTAASVRFIALATSAAGVLAFE